MTETNDKNYIIADRDLEQAHNATSDPRKKTDRKIIFTSKTKNIIKGLYFRSLTKNEKKIENVKGKITALENFNKEEEIDDIDKEVIKHKLDKLADKLEILETKHERIKYKKERPIKVAGHAHNVIKRNYTKIVEFLNKNKKVEEPKESISYIAKQTVNDEINENSISEENINIENIKNMVENEFDNVKQAETSVPVQNISEKSPVSNISDSVYSLTKDQIIQDDFSTDIDNIRVNKNPQTRIKTDSTFEPEREEIREQITPEVQAFFDKINGNISNQEIQPALPDKSINREKIEIAPEREEIKEDLDKNLTVSNEGKSKVYDFSENLVNPSPIISNDGRSKMYDFSDEESKKDVPIVSNEGKSKLYDFSEENLTNENKETVVDGMISDASVENNGKDNLEQLRELLLEQQHRQEQLEQEKQAARMRDAQAKREAEELANQKAQKVERVKAAVQAMREGNASLESEIVKLKDEEQRHLSVKQQTITEMHELDDMIQNVAPITKASKGK